MSIRDLIVHVGARPGAELNAALQLAEAHDAHLTALHVMEIPVAPMAVDAGVSAAFVEEQRRTCLETAAQARAQVHETSASAGRDVEWRVAEGETVGRVSIHARYADMIVMAASADANDHPAKRDLGERTVLDAGKPVVLVPAGYERTNLGRAVMVAWDGSREASRAVADAMPLLQKAETVSVVVVDPDREAAGLGDIPGADICRHLARHGVNAQAQTTNKGSASTGEALLQWATAQSADLMVMGAYGHWRLRELMLGGVTRDVLRGLHMPVMMSH